MERHLAAVLAADVVGYSRLISEDETGTLNALRRHRSELIQPRIAGHGGRIVKLMGDGILAEFPSAVEAVHCAVEIQQGVNECNAKLPADRRISYRIGINIGDVVSEGEDIYGDGVNVAARLEGLAEPGTVYVSRNVVDQVRGKLDLIFEHLGEREVKNIAEPIAVYNVVLDERAAALMMPAASPAARSQSHRWAAWVAGATVVLVAVLGLRQDSTPVAERASLDRMAFPLPDEPSIAVLPFVNMSDDPGQVHFADGMTEDLITDLSGISGLFVIARNSTFAYKGQTVPARQIAEELGVRYVLEGSVRRAGDQVRVNAQLIDTTTEGHVWAGRYDGTVADIFSVQDRFIRQIVKALAVNLTEEEEQEIALGQTSNIEARAKFQKGWESYLRYSPEDNAEAIRHFEAALEIDPDYGRVYAAMGLAYLRGCQLRWNAALDISASFANAKANSYLHETKSRPSSLANVAASGVSLYNRRYDDAFIEATRAIAKDPNEPEAHMALAWAMITTGKPEPALELIERAMRLNPTYPNYYVLARGTAYFALNDLEKARSVLATALERDPGAVELAPLLAATYARLGDQSKARAALQKWSPVASQQELEAVPFTYHFPYEWSEGEDTLVQLIDGLHVAALPLEITIVDLAAGLKGESKSERLRAVRFLGWFGPAAADAVPDLIDALADTDVAVRRQVAIALGKIGHDAKSAIPALRELKDAPQGVGFEARKAMKRIADN